MMSYALTALLFTRLVVAAPTPLVARAPASIRFSTPSEVATCSAPVTLSWSVRPPTGGDADSDDNTAGIRLARVVVSSATSDFARTLVQDPERDSFVWEQVDVPPGQYVITGAVDGTEAVDILASDTFTVREGDSLACLSRSAGLSSSSDAESSTTTVASASSTTSVSSTESALPTPQEENMDPAASTSSASSTGSSTPVNGGLVAGVTIIGVLFVALAGGLVYYCRRSRFADIGDIEYVYPPSTTPTAKRSAESRHSRHARGPSDTVVEIYARTPTPLGMLSRTTTKQTLVSDLDPTKTQKVLREL